MSSLNTLGSDQNSGQKKFWRSVNELENDPEFSKMLVREFPENASELKDPMSRRTFLKIMSASMFLAGFAGCGLRRPVEKILPYAKAPEDLIPGRPVFYATSYALGDEVVGVLAESHEGRPTKLEGNPVFPWNKGSLKSFHQASVLDLYDPDRLTRIIDRKKNDDISSSVLEDMLMQQSALLGSSNGKGFGILLDSVNSPTMMRLVRRMQKKYPQIKIYWYNPASQNSFHEMGVSLFDKVLRPYYDFKKARRIVSVGLDFLGATVPGSLRYTKDFSGGRDPEESKELNRLYVFESDFTLTGGVADHRFKTRSSDYASVLIKLTAAVLKKIDHVPAEFYAMKNTVQSLEQWVKAPGLDEHVLNEIAADLMAHKGECLVVACSEMPSVMQGVAVFLNALLGNIGSTYALHALDTEEIAFFKHSSFESLSSFIRDVESKTISSVLVLGGDPVYLSPAQSLLGESLGSLESVIYLADRENATSEVASLVIPSKHYLESWGDLKSQDGSVALVQPLIMPLYPEAYSAIEIVSLLLAEKKTDYDLVRETWREELNLDFEKGWKKWLHDGFMHVEDLSVSKSGVANWDQLVKHLQTATHLFENRPEFELNFKLSNTLYDGRFINNGWLQELPDPMTKLTWDNALLLSPKSAAKFGLKTGDMVSVAKDAKSAELPVYILPGHAEDSATVSVGYGQAVDGKSVCGRVGVNSGFSARNLSGHLRLGVVNGIEIKPTGKHYKLASTQDHWNMLGRPIFRGTTEDAYRDNPLFAKEMVEVPHSLSSWEEKKYDTGYQWGMAIDLSRCTGCNACVTGCQSENNIPIVGKDMVLNGREMHWIRLDRYFEGEVDNPKSAITPMTCMQCENAPCEQVCPVAATTHSEEGLNDMTYNRCIGTRYCSNNCPVKVRRFNYFDYHQTHPLAVQKNREHVFDSFKEPDPHMQKQFNPDVTIRMRGVMEKCTYCVQRINQVKIDAKNEGRKVRDGEITPACAQTCPADAISFGDILDVGSKVSQVKARNRDYALMTELHLKPRTTFLAQIKNPNPNILKSSAVKAVHS